MGEGVNGCKEIKHEYGLSRQSRDNKGLEIRIGISRGKLS